MTSHFIFSLRYSTKVFTKLGSLGLAMVLFMSVLRLALYLLAVRPNVPGSSFVEIAHSFLIGFRFDLLVIGFTFIPVYFVVVFQACLKRWPPWAFTLYKFYFTIIWFLICTLSLMDFLFFLSHGRRMRFSDYAEWNLAGGTNHLFIFLAITGILFFWGLGLIKRTHFSHWKDEFSPFPSRGSEVGLRLVIPLILVALAARGTLEPHHLGLEHSKVSHVVKINEMALNAVWCFDK